uniref:N-terminal EF-hand calcium binding protein 3 n=1 Tax=Amphilophus citrinellus TaxID=61819 RepID=A0A3Q0S4W6_AMPCI
MILPPIHPYFLSISDDGKLSFEEFNFICSSPLDYFSQHLGEYLNVLSALESLNIAILKAMDKTKEEYQGSSVLGQFVTRFMLRETSSQLLSLQRSLQCAMEAVEEQSSPAPLVLFMTICFVLSDVCVSMEDEENWCSQINRLQQLLDKLEYSNFSCTLSLLSANSVSLCILFLPHSTFLLDLTVSVSVQKLPGKLCYIMYEFWQDRISWMSYLQSNSSKDFQRCIIDMLEDAEVVSTMLLPGLYMCV